MKEQVWTRWVLQTAKTWDDIAEVVNQTGIDRIDRDYQAMIENVLELNRLIQAFEKDDLDLETIERESKLFERLYEDAARHFTWEEKFIKKLDLPGLGRQEEQHAKFLLLLHTYRRDFEKGRLWVTLNLKMAVLEWVVDHVNKEDYQTFCGGNWVPRVIEKAQSWNDLRELVHSTSLYLLDDEHKAFVIQLLELNAYKEGWDKGDQHVLSGVAGEACFRRLWKYASLHFQHEEDFIRRNLMPGMGKQQEAHQLFLHLLADFQKRAKAGKLLDPGPVKVTILGHWIDHISRVDCETFRPERWVPRLLYLPDALERFGEIIKMNGVNWVDDGNKQLLHMALTFNAAVDRFEKDESSPDGVAQVLEKLRVLIEFATILFEKEEHLIQKYEIPGLEKQKEAHEYFLKTMRSSQEAIEKKRVVFFSRIKALIISWWNDHINFTDYNTFYLDNWAESLFQKANTFEDIVPILKIIGIEWLDNDHRTVLVQTMEVYDLANKIEIMNEGGSETHHLRIIEKIQDIFQFSLNHFSREEQLMVDNALPGAEFHMEKHVEFFEGLKKYLEKPKLLQGDALIFKKWVFHWWINHINESDFPMFKQLALEKKV